MERKTGYYYVFTDSEFWDIAFYNSNYKNWFMCGVEEEFTDDDFVSINEKQIEYEN